MSLKCVEPESVWGIGQMASGAGLLGAVVSLAGFGVTMGMNPALYGATVDMLARTKNPVVRLSWMIGGLAVGATILFFVLQGLNPTHLVNLAEQELDKALLNEITDLVAGALFILGGIGTAIWRIKVPTRKRKPAKTPKEGAGLGGYFVLGLGAAIIGFTTLPIMYLTGRIVTAATTDLLLRAGLYAVFLLALAAPFVLLAFVWSRFPKFAAKFQLWYTKILSSDYRFLLAGVFVLVGLIFVGLALWPR